MPTLAPAVEAIYDQLFVAIAALTPSIEPTKGFMAISDDVDLDQFPLSAAERKFDIEVQGGLDESANANGVQGVFLADRTIRVEVQVAYAALRPRRRAVDKRIASDAEIIMRAANKSSTFGATSIHGMFPRAWKVNRAAQDGQLWILQLPFDVRYRDQEI
jgi:hypothetical protein